MNPSVLDPSDTDRNSQEESRKVNFTTSQHGSEYAGDNEYDTFSPMDQTKRHITTSSRTTQETAQIKSIQEQRSTEKQSKR